MRFSLPLVLLALGLEAGAGHAQTRPAQGNPFPPDNTVPPGTLIQSFTVGEPTRTARTAEVLPPAVLQRVQRAVDLRTSGLPERARDTLLVLLREYPHHPRIVTELGRAHLLRDDHTAVERLANTERAFTRDTLLLAPELAQAQERLSRPRDALRTALEAWTVSPGEGPWASNTVFRLAPIDPKLAITLFEAATLPRPWRTDLVLGLARLHATSGRPAEAARVLADAEKRSNRTGLRILYADESLRAGSSADTTAALTVLMELTRETTRRPEERLATGRRLWVAAQASGREAEWAPKLAQGLREVPAERWGPDFLLGLMRSLQRAGFTAEARALLGSNPALERRMPELTLERAAGLAREGQLAAARPLLDSLAQHLPQARFLRAEFEFFAGELDSAAAHYNTVVENANDPDAATALDRIYLLEEYPKSSVRPMLGAIAYERWRGRRSAAIVLADSLWRMQKPRGDYAAHAGLELAALRLEAGDARAALVPLLVVCDSLADDRLAPLARQRAGDAYAQLGDDKNALTQYEECLARYPRAWNSAEVRRRVERLRKEKRL